MRRGGKVSRGMDMGYSLPSRLGGLGSVVNERRKLPSGVRGGAEAENGFGAF